MLPDQRREKILDFVGINGFASLQQLSDLLGTSESTVRRDLDILAGNRQVRRTRGGIACIVESQSEYEERTTRALSEKQRIGRAVADLIEPGDSVLLDGGTTTLEIAKHLADRPLQIVTNSLSIAHLMVDSPQTELILIGGYLTPKTGLALGPIAVETLKKIRVRRLVLSVGGITQEGMFNGNTLLVEAEQRMLEAAEEVIVAADSGKFGRNALTRLCALDRPDHIFTDSGLSDQWRTTLNETGVKLTIVE